MGRQLVLISLLAGVVAAIVGIAVYAWDRGRQPAVVERSVDVAEVVIVHEPIPVGTRLTPELLARATRVVRWPRELLPSEAVRRPEEVVSWRVRTALHAGEPLFRFKLSGPDGVGSLPMMIDAGMRAVTVRVDDVSGVAGFVVPGSYVDVIGTFKNVRNPVFGRGAGTTFSRTLLEHVKVLAQGTRLTEPDGQPAEPRLPRATVQQGTVTLAVTPEQAEVLALAEQEGSIHLALRSFEDDGLAGPPGITRNELLGLPVDEPEPEPRPAPAAEREPPPPPPAVQVEVIRGSERSSVAF